MASQARIDQKNEFEATFSHASGDEDHAGMDCDGQSLSPGPYSESNSESVEEVFSSDGEHDAGHQDVDQLTLQVVPKFKICIPARRTAVEQESVEKHSKEVESEGMVEVVAKPSTQARAAQKKTKTEAKAPRDRSRSITPTPPPRKRKHRVQVGDVKGKKKARAVSPSHPLAKEYEPLSSDTDPDIIATLKLLPTPASRTVTASGPPRKRGRPRKETRTEVEDEDEETMARKFSISVFVEVQLDPEIVKSKGARSTGTLKAGEIHPFDPVTLTHDMEWEDLLVTIAREAGVEVAALQTNSFAWRWYIQDSPPKKEKLVVISMAQPRPKIQKSSHARLCFLVTPLSLTVPSFVKPWLSGTDEPVRGFGGGGVTRGQEEEVRYDSYASQKNWHFELDPNRLNVWANEILQNHTNYAMIPLHSKFFQEDQTIGFRAGLRNAGRQLPQIGSAYDRPAPPHFNAYDRPTRYSGQHDYRQSPMRWEEYGDAGTPVAGPSTRRNHSAERPDPSRTSSHYTRGLPSTPVHALSDRSSPIPGIDLDDWCTQMALDEATCEKLHTLGFQVGDNIKTLPETDWQEAGFKRLEWQRVLKADKKYRSSVKPYADL
ncbi:hypothetical protein BV25DRAFT_1918836 [Artomyces pyxidatus]|uniref:Uncharacterized protein n=1 Tax=Artomyces pyxidatus TaxID=48021 RepID=A0ACB8SRT9_9AGAM|nr:hypothetical protein BV25DRAFT_1918836 [Artomyces pyxidatus]